MWRSLAPDDDTPSWIDLAASNTSLAEHLSAQILPSLPRELRHVGEYVVGCVNDNGYLYEPVEEIALACNCSIEEAASVIAALRKCDPPGIGANGVQDCILIQLKAHQTLEGKIARKIVRDHLDEFATGKVMKFARKFSAHPDVIEESIRLIYECTPFPGESFKGAHSSEQKLPAIKPDLILSRSEFGWDIVVVGPDPAEFSVNGFYRDRLVNNKRDKSVSPEEKRHLSVYVQRASDFISSIEQRRKTMQRIAEVLVQAGSSIDSKDLLIVFAA